jgi:hypothetical protein
MIIIDYNARDRGGIAERSRNESGRTTVCLSSNTPAAAAIHAEYSDDLALSRALIFAAKGRANWTARTSDDPRRKTITIYSTRPHGEH